MSGYQFKNVQVDPKLYVPTNICSLFLVQQFRTLLGLIHPERPVPSSSSRMRRGIASATKTKSGRTPPSLQIRGALCENIFVAACPIMEQGWAWRWQLLAPTTAQRNLGAYFDFPKISPRHECMLLYRVYTYRYLHIYGFCSG